MLSLIDIVFPLRAGESGSWPFRKQHGKEKCRCSKHVRLSGLCHRSRPAGCVVTLVALIGFISLTLGVVRCTPTIQPSLQPTIQLSEAPTVEVLNQTFTLRPTGVPTYTLEEAVRACEF